MSLHLFEATGIELEYMIVGPNDLKVRPISDQLLMTSSRTPGHVPISHDGSQPSESAFGQTGWSNELVLHVIEFKTLHPSTDLEAAERSFMASVHEANRLLHPLGATLLGSSAHPFMDPTEETRLWPHGSREIYEAYDRIFNCSGHGWSNLQSMHINLPFSGDEEFGRLHAAIRAVLPLLAPLCASSPVIEARSTGLIDTRLEYYRNNQKKIPLLSGSIIPEPVYSETRYREQILAPIYRELAPYDPDGTLQDEWVNSRGAIARFDRGAIEIRTMDIQECPAMDLAVAEATVRLVRMLCEERFAPLSVLQSLPTSLLADLFLRTMRHGGNAIVDDPVLLRVLGVHVPASVRAIWTRLLAILFNEDDADNPQRTEALRRRLSLILTRGNLSERILGSLGRPEPGTTLSHESLLTTYGELASSLATGVPFDPPPGSHISHQDWSTDGDRDRGRSR